MFKMVLVLVLLSMSLASLPPGFQEVYSETFDSPSTVSADYTLAEGRWHVVEGLGPGNTNNAFTRRAENVRIEDGHLVLEGRRETYTVDRDGHRKEKPFTSAMVQTHCGPRQGDWCRNEDGRFNDRWNDRGSWSGDTPTYITVRAKIPAGKGLWPAIWLMPTRRENSRKDFHWPQSGEIDIFEAINSADRTVHSTLHFGSVDTTCGTKFHIPETMPDTSEAFHDYALLWDNSAEERKFRFFFDGIEISNDDCDSWQPGAGMIFPEPFSGSKFYLILNLAIGGSWPGDPEPSFTSGKMLVDQVKVYQKEN